MNQFSELEMSVLVCSTSRPLRQALQASLRAMGCRSVAGAGNVDDITAILSSQKIDAVLIGDATENRLTDHLQDHAPELPLIGLESGETRANPAVQALKKPFRCIDLANSLQFVTGTGQRETRTAMAV